MVLINHQLCCIEVLCTHQIISEVHHIFCQSNLLKQYYVIGSDVYTLSVPKKLECIKP
jgi:hypothetical protein